MSEVYAAKMNKELLTGCLKGFTGGGAVMVLGCRFTRYATMSITNDSVIGCSRHLFFCWDSGGLCLFI